MSKQDAAYIAGFIDGEGYIGLLKVKHGNKSHWNHSQEHYFTPVLKIASTNHDIINWFQSSFGGSGAVERRTFTLNCKDAYTWQLRSVKKLEPFLSLIRPYLRIKRQQADIVLQLCKMIRKTGQTIETSTDAEREEWYKQIRTLNRRGRLVQGERLSVMTPETVMR